MLNSGSSTTRTRTSGTSITASTAATLDRAAKAHLQAPSSSALHPHLYPPVSYPPLPPPLLTSAASSFCTVIYHNCLSGFPHHSSPTAYTQPVYSLMSGHIFFVFERSLTLRSDGEVIDGRESKHNECYLLCIDCGCLNCKLRISYGLKRSVVYFLDASCEKVTGQRDRTKA